MGKYKCITWISLFSAVVALGISLYNTKGRDYDSVMFAVAMLSALVTILIGWNIYSILDIRNLKSEISKKLDEQRDEYFKATNISLKQNEQTRNRLARMTYLSLDKEDDDTKDYAFILLGIEAASIDLSNNNFDSAIKTIDKLIRRIKTISIMEEKYKLDLLKQLLEVPQTAQKNIHQRIEVLTSSLLNL